MKTLPIVLLPDPILRKRSRPIERVDADLHKFAGQMLDTMYEAPGIGLAAIQVGEPRRMLVIDLSKDDEPKDPHVFINPEILDSASERSIYEEGCLSIPETFAEVERPAEVTVSYIDLDGKKQEMRATGLMATCLQHEIDHLNGLLFIDHISRLKRDMVIKKFRKLAKERASSRMVG